MSMTTDNFSSLIGGRLAEERKRLGFNQEEAGHACGVSREMWGKYERGRAVMGTEGLSKFGIAGADVLYILTGQRSGGASVALPSPRQAALLDNFEHLSEDDKRALERTASALAQSQSDGMKKAG